MARCSHGLDRDWCPTCQEAAEIRSMVATGSPTVSARYSQTCPSCGDRIEVGDPIRMDEDSGSWVCASCS